MTKPSPQIQVPTPASRMKEQMEEDAASYKPQEVLPQEDSSDRAHTDQTVERQNSNFDQKIYMFPESYNALRKELIHEWPVYWVAVQWHMAFDAAGFVSMMNVICDRNIQFDTQKVDATCKEFLNSLRKKRGVSPL